MLGEPWPEIIIATQSLDDAGREESLCQLYQFEAAIRSKRRRLENDCISCNKCWDNFTTRKMEWVVPGDDGNSDTERLVADGDQATVVIVEDLVVEIN
jgi:hypothetical protein